MAHSAKRIVIGSDHGGVELKSNISDHLRDRGYQVDDIGVYTDDSVDYPDIIEEVCRRYLKGDYEFAVALCGTGIGASIAANKIAGIRCALLHDVFTATMAREHNNANVIALGGRVRYSVPVESILDAYLDASFAGGRHSRRIGKIAELERQSI